MSTGERQARFQCSELVTIHWRDMFGHEREDVVNLEEIWTTGVALQCNCPIRLDTVIRITCKGIEFRGTVTRSGADFVGFAVEAEFAEGCTWAPEIYEPEHFFDPRTLLSPNDLKDKNNRLLRDVLRHLPTKVG